jgi:hypothetical protein
MNDPREVLAAASALIDERGLTYGGIERSFNRAADLASLKLNMEISPYMVAIVLESVKDARRAENPSHVDSHLDGINYRAFAFTLRNQGMK